MTAPWKIYTGDVRRVLLKLEDESVQTVVTSPPYWGLRDYGHADQLGGEKTVTAYAQSLVEVFREIRRVLRSDGTVWLNLGDSYITNPRGNVGADSSKLTNPKRQHNIPRPRHTEDPKAPRRSRGDRPNRYGDPGRLKHKDMVGVPWRVAFALQDDGWYLRSDIIWHKPNPLPESVIDRPTKSHEYIFLLSKSRRYYYDKAAIMESCEYGDHPRNGTPELADIQAPGQPKQAGFTKRRRSGNKERKSRSDHGGVQDDLHRKGQKFGVPWEDEDGKRNKRSVWTVATVPLKEEHYAAFPPALIEPCILAGAPAGGVVLDPFCGSGTVGMVSLRHQRAFVGIELVKKSAALARRRILNDAPLLNHVAAEPAALRELRQIDMFPTEKPAEKPVTPAGPMVN
jgi:DNA modification methylase